MELVCSAAPDFSDYLNIEFDVEVGQEVCLQMETGEVTISAL